ncbi:hypothetical protein METBIDRAFT_29464 [Metschnikowia bicuspidata var. bicuspidata NRRL YB-4993]|uniref:Uncharacterized protein n=1 Tax=Metschnikowia bicuspidata var. bicuspidata NRRL YB-4993 TaxID=869754 RepID=A0A1A0HFV7_9ASCO|nr:hypothetical protein METBIDRAFT_29464 [Metschnikowia bicuspidata var. bicuspidata NRRL YB-4993]OBA22886.1 hypothetical protein METBIDRAFT_29464 [Metschnikowia bicuspidata var. bicuspidata NRRL YB-4993]
MYSMISRNTSNIPPILEIPDKPTFDTFIDSSQWLLENQSLLEGLTQKYRPESLLFQKVMNSFAMMNLAEYKPSKSGVSEFDNSHLGSGEDNAKLREDLHDHDYPSSKGVGLELGLDPVSNIDLRPNSTIEQSEVIVRPSAPDQNQGSKPSRYQQKISFESIGNEERRLLFRLPSIATPETSVTSVIILKKVTNMSNYQYRPSQHTPSNLFFKNLIRGHLSQISPKKKTEEQGIFKVIRADTVMGSSGDPQGRDESKIHESHNYQPRRQSLVGKSLPPYIYDQIKSHEKFDKKEDITSFEASKEDQGDLLVSSKTGLRVISNGASGVAESTLNIQTDAEKKDCYKSVTKGKTLNHILETSLSLYHQRESNLTVSEIESNSLVGSDSIEFDVSDADREYVLPCFFAKSLEDLDGNVTYENINSEVQHEETSHIISSVMGAEEEVSISSDSVEMRLFH